MTKRELFEALDYLLSRAKADEQVDEALEKHKGNLHIKSLDFE